MSLIGNIDARPFHQLITELQGLTGQALRTARADLARRFGVAPGVVVGPLWSRDERSQLVRDVRLIRAGLWVGGAALHYTVIGLLNPGDSGVAVLVTGLSVGSSAAGRIQIGTGQGNVLETDLQSMGNVNGGFWCYDAAGAPLGTLPLPTTVNPFGLYGDAGAAADNIQGNLGGPAYDILVPANTPQELATGEILFELGPSGVLAIVTQSQNVALAVQVAFSVVPILNPDTRLQSLPTRSAQGLYP